MAEFQKISISTDIFSSLPSIEVQKYGNRRDVATEQIFT
jgi:hypothetical protein